MTKESVYVGVDVAKNTLDVADSDSHETRQFANDDEHHPSRSVHS